MARIIAGTRHPRGTIRSKFGEKLWSIKFGRKSISPSGVKPMSEMLPHDQPIQTLQMRTSGDVRYDGGDAAAAGQNWLDRWVDIVQVAPPRRTEQMVASPTMERNFALITMTGGVLLTFFVITLTLATIEVLFRKTIYERQR